MLKIRSLQLLGKLATLLLIFNSSNDFYRSFSALHAIGTRLPKLATCLSGAPKSPLNPAAGHIAVSTCPDFWGKHKPLAGMQFSVNGAGRNGKKLWIPYRSAVPLEKGKRERNRWILYGIPLRGTADAGWENIDQITGLRT